MLRTSDPSAPLFDEFVESYEDACGRGLALSGESRDYFALQRTVLTARLLHERGGGQVTRIVDFGCGLGHTVPYLDAAFPGATIIGIDEAEAAIRFATERYGSERVRFATDLSSIEDGSIDLVYSNGTFHHIEPEGRDAVVAAIGRWLAPRGLFMLWENNPWNPGTRLVMRRIPFDRDAKTLSPPVARQLLTRNGLQVHGLSAHFYFPSWLNGLRRFERALEGIPLGAQYCVMAARDSNAAGEMPKR